MEAFIDYLSEMPSLHRSGVLIGGLTLFLLLENAAPVLQLKYDKWRHGFINVFFTITTILVNFLMAFVLYFTAAWVVENNFGLLQWIELPFVLYALVGLMVLDFVGSWLIHFIEHKFKFLWMFHLIHHTDQHVDATTANRHHPGESVLRFIFTTLAVLVTGAPIWLVFLYQSLSAFTSQFNHSNIKIPTWLDSALVWVICTPNMHRVHHHYRQPYSDSNYGNIFSFWDRIFGTYQKVDQSKLKFGVDTYMDAKEINNIGEMLKIPFAGYRPHIKYEQEEKL